MTAFNEYQTFRISSNNDPKCTYRMDSICLALEEGHSQNTLSLGFLDKNNDCEDNIFIHLETVTDL